MDTHLVTRNHTLAEKYEIQNTSFSTTSGDADESSSDEYDTDLEDSFKEDKDFHKT